MIASRFDILRVRLSGFVTVRGVEDDREQRGKRTVLSLVAQYVTHLALGIMLVEVIDGETEVTHGTLRGTPKHFELPLDLARR